MNKSAWINLVITFAAIALVGVGLGLSVNPGAGIASAGALIWLDMLIGACKK